MNSNALSRPRLSRESPHRENHARAQFSSALGREDLGGKAPAPLSSGSGQASTTKPLPEGAIAIIPVRNVVLFPGVIMPVSMRRPASVAAAQEATKADLPIGLLLQRNAEEDNPTPDDLYWVGTVANVVRYVTTPDGSHHFVCQGESRFRVLQFLEGWPFLVARIERIKEVEVDSPEIAARALTLKARAAEVLRYLPQAP